MENQPQTSNDTPTVYIAKSGGVKSKTSYKLIIIVLVILLIILGEAGYLVYSRYYQSNLPPAEDTSIARVIPTESLSPTPDVRKVQNYLNEAKVAFVEKYLSDIKDKTEFVDTLNIHLVNHGYVEEAGPDNTQENGILYYYKLKIRSEINNYYTYRFTKAEYDEAKLFINKAGGSNEAKFSDLTKNTMVAVEISTNLRDSKDKAVMIRIFPQ